MGTVRKKVKSVSWDCGDRSDGADISWVDDIQIRARHTELLVASPEKSILIRATVEIPKLQPTVVCCAKIRSTKD